MTLVRNTSRRGASSNAARARSARPDLASAAAKPDLSARAWRDAAPWLRPSAAGTDSADTAAVACSASEREKELPMRRGARGSSERSRRSACSGRHARR
nr:unnamed protein product [Digitaria exilis]